eukprot:c12722_g1_i4.p1 GENE.c12722_g1_i4~~c12722_g1_i4.p1  ORF type:complete len:663 (+),score=134.95 c12722_g1_i4:53-1990(+)
MGFLTDGRTMTWEEALPHVEYVKNHGVEQFINMFRLAQAKQTPEFLWGDEVEFLVVKLEDEEARLNLRGPQILQQLVDSAPVQDPPAIWHPEYGSFMVEATPGKPYHGLAIGEVEENMRYRRRTIQSILGPDEFVISMSNFPRLGAQGGLWDQRLSTPFASPHSEPGGPHSESQFTPDSLINPHPRFGTLTGNIRKRRGSKVCICVPLFMDKFTQPVPNSRHRTLSTEDLSRPATPSQFYGSDAMECSCCLDTPAIYMDSMAFGMGCCCLQTTFQCRDLAESRDLYDQLAVLCPFMLALSAACPILKGLLAATDCRWSVISGSVDDRTPEERGKEGDPAKKIAKSRYDSISSYLSESPLLDEKYHNDIQLEVNKAAMDRLLVAGVDPRMARHIAHLFVRDPLVIYSNRIELNDEVDIDHWENIQSTNWQSMRFKPPSPDSPIGWRVEFRVLELQLTDFENAAFAVFMALLVQVIKHYKLNFYMPISLVDTNMRYAQTLDAVTRHKFTLRAQILPPTDPNFHVFYHQPEADRGIELDKFSVNDLLNGSGNFKGLLAGVRTYAQTVVADEVAPHADRLDKYLSLLSQRASGSLITAARWMRNFVVGHPAYNHDSVVNPEINRDLMLACRDLAEGKIHAPELLGDLVE